MAVDDAASDAASALRRFAMRARRAAEAERERCDLCAEPVPDAHRHLLRVESGEILCACTACSILFHRKAAGAGEYRLIPERRLSLQGFCLSDALWQSLRIPVGLAFLVEGAREGRVRALYPSAMGPVESELPGETWNGLLEENPVLREMESDVETLLVNRARGARRYYIAPLDDAFRLAGVLRTRWRGLTGGQEVWVAIEAFFDELNRKSRPVGSVPHPAGREGERP